MLENLAHPWPVIYYPLIFLSSYLLVGFYRYWAIKNHWLDVPNHRSSHSAPVPGGAGLVFLFIYTLGLFSLFFSMLSVSQLFYWFFPVLMGLVGGLDDRVELSRGIRFMLYALCIVLALLLKGTISSLQVVSFILDVPALLFFISAFLLVWFVNLYNFMDGINGLVGWETLFFIIALLFLDENLLYSAQGGLAMVVACTVSGFLLWNFPKAKVFMGDAGSIFLGAFIGFIVLDSTLSIWVCGTLLGIFLVDATYTLLARLTDGQPWREAHKVHLYQILARRLQSHVKVVALIMFINILWLLPMAYLASVNTHYAALIMLGAWLPLIGLCHFFGAGQLND